MQPAYLKSMKEAWDTNAPKFMYYAETLYVYVYEHTCN